MKALRLLLLCGVSLCMTAVLARPIRVGMIHWIAFSPLNVAESKGFWKEQGLEVQVTNFPDNQSLNAALQSKKIDIALDMIGSWVGLHQQGVPIVILGETDWSHGGDKIIGRNGVDVKALKGKTIGIYLNQPSVTYFLNQYLKQNGLRLADVKAVEATPEKMTDEFIQGRFPLIVNYDPQALRARRQGNGVEVANSSNWPGVIPEGFVGNAETLKEIPADDLRRFFVGWVHAVRWVKNDAAWAEYQKILNGMTFAGEKPYTAFDLIGMLNSVRIHNGNELLRRNRPEGGLIGYLRDLKQFLQENQQLKRSFEPEQLVDTSALLAALKTAQ
ncbi:ABC transporter substrate-binding protein [Leeia sp.]|uniref:ABC transporter substrate-binding protein n=1 Tax=Leeia sp. TaxID=2884678 RepID=UPI0035B189DB